ncbi:hypothetical protein HaLaN_07162 [Haematococcus lacustris]|uniref:Uncharacterized protein n=1 Tax=Haematococcus lacustris TaxID=44745 RepID=A0A699YPY9_HAELA|nr:hypothetical protein HaLaN_07162 [Haematococcus lacustris]
MQVVDMTHCAAHCPLCGRRECGMRCKLDLKQARMHALVRSSDPEPESNSFSGVCRISCLTEVAGWAGENPGLHSALLPIPGSNASCRQHPTHKPSSDARDG